MAENKTRIFKAIKSFVEDLDNEFGRKYRPVALYNRLVSKTSETDEASIDKHVRAFTTFFNEYPGYIKNKTVPPNAQVKYSDRVYLDISQILVKTSRSIHKHIHQHLLMIYSFINIETEDGRQALQSLQREAKEKELDLNIPDTAEGNFIKDALTEMTDQFESMGDTENPMAVMANMMQSGFFTKFMGDLQGKFSNGEMDIKNLLGTVTGVMGEVAPEDNEQASQMQNFMTNQINTITQNAEIPDDIQGELKNVMGALSKK